MNNEETDKKNETDHSWKSAASEQLVKEYDPSHYFYEGEQHLIQFGPFTTIANDTLTLFQCDCPYPSEDECHHVLATRKILSTPYRSPTISTSPSSKSPFPIRQLIQSIPQADLRAFTREFTRQNKEFKFLLRARFIELDGDPEDAQVYLDLYNEILHQRKMPSSPLPLQDLKIFRSVTHTFIEKSVILIAEKNYTAAYKILFSIADRLSLVMYRTPKRSEQLLPIWIKVHLHLEELIKRVEAPDFLRRITYQLLSLAPKLYYRYWRFDIHLIHLLLPLLEFEDNAPFIEHFSNRLEAEGDSVLRQNMLGAALVLVSSSDTSNTLISKLSQQHLLHGPQYLDLARQLEESGHPEVGIALLQAGLNHHDSIPYLQQYLSYLRRNSPDKAAFTSLLVRSLHRYPTVSFAMKICPSPEELDDEILRSFLQHATLSPPLSILLFQWLGDMRAALHVAKTTPLDQLRTVDTLFWNKHADDITHIYLHKLDNHLQHHLGPAAQSYVTGILLYLAKKRTPDALKHESRAADICGELKALILSLPRSL